MSPRAFGLLALAVLAACDGIGKPVVGEIPRDPQRRTGSCFETRCDDVLAPREPVWEPNEALGVQAASCTGRSEVRLDAPDFAVAADRYPTLNCVDLFLEADEPFAIDLREVPVVGARIDVRASAPGTLWLGGAVSALELSVHGPVDVHVAGGALGASRIVLDGSSPDRLATLSTDRVLVTDVAVEAPYGLVRAEHTQLARFALSALEVELSFASASNGSIEASRVTLLDASLARVDLGAETLLAAAGELRDIDVFRCGAVDLSVSHVSRTRIARCAEAVMLRDVDLERSLVDADVVGSARVRQSGLRGERIELERSRVTLTAFCGVESLRVWETSIECPSCQPAPPVEVCGGPRLVQPYCPGFETAPCDGERAGPSSLPGL